MDLLSTISSSITLLTRLRAISENIKDAEFKNLLADLSLNMADLKLKLADAQNEQLRLHQRIAQLENVEGDPCPKCRKNGWQLKDSSPDPTFGDMGLLRRTYQCTLCGFSETEQYDSMKKSPRVR